MFLHVCEHKVFYFFLFLFTILLLNLWIIKKRVLLDIRLGFVAHYLFNFCSHWRNGWQSSSKLHRTSWNGETRFNGKNASFFTYINFVIVYVYCKCKKLWALLSEKCRGFCCLQSFACIIYLWYQKMMTNRRNEEKWSVVIVTFWHFSARIFPSYHTKFSLKFLLQLF